MLIFLRFSDQYNLCCLLTCRKTGWAITQSSAAGVIQVETDEFPDDANAKIEKVNEAKELISYAREMLVDRSLEFEAFTVGTRPVPIDGLPVIGRAPGISGLYITVMHSGITLAPLVGRLGAADILSGCASDELKDYRLERFL